MAQCKKGLGYRHIQTPMQIYKTVFLNANKKSHKINQLYFNISSITLNHRLHSAIYSIEDSITSPH